LADKHQEVNESIEISCRG